jgi:acyl carrier protein
MSESVPTVSRGQHEEILSVVRDHVAEILGLKREQVADDSELLSLGAESFDFVELVFRLEQSYRIGIPRSYAIPDTHTVDAFARAVAVALVEQGKAH